ncbi:MAG TPA: hypothetical protein VGM67_15640 [Gemmatimonadaceae bacterium]
MVPQQATARSDDFQIVPPDVANAASRYQRLREIEAEHLALMARHNLLEEWTPEARATVLAARDRIGEAREARAAFRVQVRDFVLALRDSRAALPAVLRHTRMMLQLLESTGAVRGDGGWFEAEVLEWAIEEFESPLT